MFALLVVFYPLWIVVPCLIGFPVLLGSFAIFGADKAWSVIIKAFRAYAARSPEHAQRLAVHLDVFAMPWDALLDRMPEGSVNGLYLPDFQSIQVAADVHYWVVGDRLSRMQASG